MTITVAMTTAVQVSMAKAITAVTVVGLFIARAIKARFTGSVLRNGRLR